MSRSGWGFDLSGLDPSVDPREDFFRYANGKWFEMTAIPADQASWGTFEILEQENRLKLKAILETLLGRQDLAASSNEQKLRDFYATGLDMEKRNAQGVNAILPKIRRIFEVSNLAGLTPVIAHLTLLGTKPVWLVDIDQDPKDTKVISLFLLQGGLGLPNREYYLADDKAEIRAEYLNHMRRMFELLGYAQEFSSTMANDAMEIETELAKVSWTPAERRNIPAQCNYFTVEGLRDLVPQIDWKQYFELCGIDTARPVIVGQPGFFAKVADLLNRLPIAKWQSYLYWKLIAFASPYLSQKYVDEAFDFYGRTLRGQKELKPVWELCVVGIDQLMGEALGKLYVERHFPPEAKAKMLELIKNVVAAFEERIVALPWMTDATKAKAINKLHVIKWKIGYPDKWRDYSELAIKDDSYAMNVFRAKEFDSRWQLSMVGKPMDPTLWYMSPPTVNAYASWFSVEMVFPAGILQPPFFDPEADDAVNYGAIGWVISHELTHHFDDQGCDFDEKGNLNNWWASEDKEAFEKLSVRVREQFNAYELYGKHVNGQLTLGENIADLGGLSTAFQAYQRAHAGQSFFELYSSYDGFTPAQKFFLGSAQVWRRKMTEKLTLERLIIDPHAPAQFRVNGPLSNMPEFYTAFGVSEGNAMFRPAEERAKVW